MYRWCLVFLFLIGRRLVLGVAWLHSLTLNDVERIHCLSVLKLTGIECLNGVLCEFFSPDGGLCWLGAAGVGSSWYVTCNGFRLRSQWCRNADDVNIHMHRSIALAGCTLSMFVRVRSGGVPCQHPTAAQNQFAVACALCETDEGVTHSVACHGGATALPWPTMSLPGSPRPVGLLWPATNTGTLITPTPKPQTSRNIISTRHGAAVALSWNVQSCTTLLNCTHRPVVEIAPGVGI